MRVDWQKRGKKDSGRGQTELEEEVHPSASPSLPIDHTHTQNWRQFGFLSTAVWHSSIFIKKFQAYSRKSFQERGEEGDSVGDRGRVKQTCVHCKKRKADFEVEKTEIKREKTM